MNKLILAAALLISTSTFAQSLPFGEAKCRFKGEDGKHDVRCRVEFGGATPVERVPSCFPVEFDLECSNGFDLEDQFATEFFRNEGRDGIVVAIEHDRTAVVRFDAPVPTRDFEVDAELTIREDDEAIALEGSCELSFAPAP